MVNISFITADSKDATVRVLDLSGKEVIRMTKDNLNGRFDGSMDISKLADGIYMLEISTSDMSAKRKLIKD